MFVDHLLLAIGNQHHHKVIVARNDSTELEAVHRKQGYRYMIPAGFFQDGFLQIYEVRHMYSFFLLGYTHLNTV